MPALLGCFEAIVGCAGWLATQRTSLRCLGVLWAPRNRRVPTDRTASDVQVNRVRFVTHRRLLIHSADNLFDGRYHAIPCNHIDLRMRAHASVTSIMTAFLA